MSSSTTQNPISEWLRQRVRVKGVLLPGSGLGVGTVDHPEGNEVEKE
jgi:hypothetical protein